MEPQAEFRILDPASGEELDAFISNSDVFDNGMDNLTITAIVTKNNKFITCNVFHAILDTLMENYFQKEDILLSFIYFVFCL